MTVEHEREPVLLQRRPVLLDAVDAVEAALDLAHERACPVMSVPTSPKIKPA